ncbi:MAG: hypothetical protein P8Y10_13085 [Gemmatimonadales bacterium]
MRPHDDTGSRKLLLAGVLAFGITGCLGDPFEPSVGDFYGSEAGVIMILTASGADLEWDCAAGQITEPFETAEDGLFDLEGTYTPGSGGPVQEDNPPVALAARYTGTQTELNRLTLSVEVPERDLTLGPYFMRLGQGVVLNRCL